MQLKILFLDKDACAGLYACGIELTVAGSLQEPGKLSQMYSDECAFSYCKNNVH